MNITIHITKEDINKAEFLNKNCAESLALKRTLESLNIHVLDTGVSRNPKNNTMWAEIFYATKHPSIQDAAYIHCFKTFLHKKNPKLPKWSAIMDSCFNGIWHNGIRINNITYTHKDKNTVKETSYVITIPQKVINASNDSKWVKENTETYHKRMNNDYEQKWWTLGRENGIYHNVSENSFLTKILKKYDGQNIQWDDLPCGAFSGGNFNLPNFRTVEGNKIKCPRHKPNDNHFFPTHEYTANDLQQKLDKVIRNYSKKPNFGAIVTIRNIVPSMDYIEAGIAFQWDNNQSSKE